MYLATEHQNTLGKIWWRCKKKQINPLLYVASLVAQMVKNAIWSFGCVPLTAILLGRGASPCLWHQFNNTVASACSSGLKAVTSSHCVSPWVPQHHLLVPLKEFHQNEPYFSSGCWLQLSTQDADTFLFFSFLLFPFLLNCGKNTWDTPSWQIFKCMIQW